VVVAVVAVVVVVVVVVGFGLGFVPTRITFGSPRYEE
jgi:hypothetical protein